MGAAAKIILVTAGIAFANEWYNTNTPNFKIPVAGIIIAWIFQGIEDINENAAVGLATMAFLSALLVPVDSHKSPVETAGKILGAK